MTRPVLINYIGKICESQAATIHSRWEAIIAAKALAAARSIGRRLRRAFILRTFVSIPKMESAADWPISYEELKPYYELMELELPVSGPAYFPWGDPHGYAFGPHPMGGIGNVLIRGCTKLGIRVSAGGPVGILQGSRADRPHCIYRGFCIQGCKVGAKASTLITHVPDAIAHGAEIRPHCMVSRINLGSDRRVSGVTYFDREGREHFQKAKAVVVCRLFHRNSAAAAEFSLSRF